VLSLLEERRVNEESDCEAAAFFAGALGGLSSEVDDGLLLMMRKEFECFGQCIAAHNARTDLRKCNEGGLVHRTASFYFTV
jgi:hypothetical protein